jgi:hypothetical protein
MNTFHIEPTDRLAFEAYPQVQEILKTQGNLWVAVRGECDLCGNEEVSTVSPCPDQDDRSKYTWTYILAQDWIDAYTGAL